MLYSCDSLGPGRFEKLLGQSRGSLERSWDALGTVLDALGRLLGTLGALLGRSCGVLERSWGHVGKKKPKTLFFGPQLGRQNTPGNREKSMLKNIFFSNTCFK